MMAVDVEDGLSCLNNEGELRQLPEVRGKRGSLARRVSTGKVSRVADHQKSILDVFILDEGAPLISTIKRATNSTTLAQYISVNRHTIVTRNLTRERLWWAWRVGIIRNGVQSRCPNDFRDHARDPANLHRRQCCSKPRWTGSCVLSRGGSAPHQC